MIYEELTTEMHKEFTVSKSTEIRNRVITVMMIYGGKVNEIEDDILKSYNLTMDDVNDYKGEYVGNYRKRK